METLLEVTGRLLIRIKLPQRKNTKKEEEKERDKIGEGSTKEKKGNKGKGGKGTT